MSLETLSMVLLLGCEGFRDITLSMVLLLGCEGFRDITLSMVYHTEGETSPSVWYYSSQRHHPQYGITPEAVRVSKTLTASRSITTEAVRVSETHPHMVLLLGWEGFRDTTLSMVLLLRL